MGAVSTSSIFNIGSDIISTAVEGKNSAITYRLGWLGNPENPDGDPDSAITAQHWGQLGVAARPAKADPDGDAAPGRSAQTLSINMAGENHVIAVRDLRTNRIFGQLMEGETALYGASEGRVLIKADGSVNIYTTEGNEQGATGMGIFVNPDKSITLASSTGASVQLDSDGNAKMFNPNAAVQVKMDGNVKVSGGTKVTISAPSVAIGDMTATPAANLTDITSLLGMITTLQAEIVALQAAIVAISTFPAVAAWPATAPAVAASTTAVGIGTVSIPITSAAVTTTMTTTRRTVIS